MSERLDHAPDRIPVPVACLRSGRPNSCRPAPAIGYGTENFVGKNRLDVRDPDGVMIVQEFIKLAQAKGKGKGWVDYKYPNPTTNKNQQKSSFLEFYDGLIIGCGIYKEQ